MTGKDILTALGGIEDKYIQEAEFGAAPLQFKEKKAAPSRKLAKFILLAAALSLFLTGCAYAVFKVQDMMYEKVPVTVRFDDNGETIEPTEKVLERYTPFSLTDGPIAKATREWNEFLDGYDPGPFTAESIEGVPENLLHSYDCTNREMANKLQEIADKYDLKLLDTVCFGDSFQKNVMYEALKIDGIFRPGVEMEVVENQSNFWPNGTFEDVKEITLTGADAIWRDKMVCFFDYNKKDTFWERTGAEIAGEYDQWHYTTADGTDVLLVQNASASTGTIIADAGDGIIFIRFGFIEEMNRDSHKEGLEQIADIFDYHIAPQPFDREEVVAKIEAGRQAYQDSLPKPEEPTWADYGAVLKAQPTLDNLFYALYDINGDGVEDLLLGNGLGGFAEAYTMKDGKAHVLQPHWHDSYWVCEDYMVEAVTRDPDGNDKDYVIRHYFGGKELKVVDDDLLIFQHNQWHRGRYYDNVVSAEEAQSVMDKYPHVTIEFKPTKDYPG